MKTLLLYLLLATSHISADDPRSMKSRQAVEEKVFVCVGGSAYAYHKTKKCSWLQNCTHTIKEVTLTEAKEEYRRRPCKPCYGL